MTTPKHVVKSLRDAETRFLHGFNEAGKKDLFAGLVHIVTDATGKVSFPILTRQPSFQKLVGQITPEGLDAATYSIEADPYIAAMDIPLSELKRGIATVGGGSYMRLFQGMGEQIIHSKNKVMTAFLEANGNDVLGSAFFGNSGAIPNSKGAITLDNLDGVTGTSAANMQADMDDIIDLMLATQNSAGDYVHTDAMIAPKTVMVPAALATAAWEAFEKADGSAAETNKFKKYNISVVVNPYLASGTAWYVFLSGGLYPPLVLLQEQLAPELRNNAGGVNGALSGDWVEQAVQLTDKVTLSARHPYTVGWGNRSYAFKTA